ncbi:MAG: single-stranded-DNA-specific exonuclease RecJ [Myxococcota bacterium]
MLSLTGARWTVREVDRRRAQELAQAAGLSFAAASVLSLRWEEGTSPDQWLTPSIDQLHDPLAMRNMGEALERLRRAVARRERIRVVTDYDVDGTTSSLILQAALRCLDPSVDVTYHIPSRFDEGYGFSVRAAQQAAADGVSLIVTADIGVRDHAAIAAAREAGLDVLVCDHHLPAGAAVPEDATVLCPPQVGDTYPNRALAACGVSLKVAQALVKGHKSEGPIVRSMLKLAAIGTVADMVSLGTSENRAIVALGLAELNRGPHHAGLQALLDVCRLDPGAIDEVALGFRIGPRINAAGRLADAGMVVELLGLRDPAIAGEKARQLDALNTARRDLQRQIVAEAIDHVGESPAPFVVVSGHEAAGWHRGVVGIVASRLKDHAHRPVAVVSIQGELAVGSVRSIPGVHAVAALESVSDLLLKFGGHPMAAGFTVRAADLPALAARLAQFVTATVPAGELVPTRRADVVVAAEDLTERLHAELLRLGPFGSGNPQPALILPGVRPFAVQVKSFGAKGEGAAANEGTLLKFLVGRGGARAIAGVWWGAGAMAEPLQQGPVDLLVHLSENHWNGERTLQLDVRDARPAQ